MSVNLNEPDRYETKCPICEKDMDITTFHDPINHTTGTCFYCGFEVETKFKLDVEVTDVVDFSKISSARRKVFINKFNNLFPAFKLDTIQSAKYKRG